MSIFDIINSTFAFIRFDVDMLRVFAVLYPLYILPEQFLFPFYL